MSIKPLLLGYSGKIYIAGKQALMTSYQLSLNANFVKSNAVFPMKYAVDGSSSSGYQLPQNILTESYADYPIYELSVTIELHKSMLSYLIEQLNQHFQNPIEVKFTDSNNGIALGFNECYVNSFSLSVEKGSLTTASLTFCYYSETFQFESSSHSLLKGHYPSSSLVGNVLIPYWRWGISNNDSNGLPILNFTINFNRTITPKYGVGKRKKPHALVFAVPSIAFEASLILLGFDITKYYFDTDIQQNYSEITFKSASGSSITFERYKIETFTPSIANKSDVNTISMSGVVYKFSTSSS